MELEMHAMVFAQLVDGVGGLARRFGCEVPAFRSPPRGRGPLRWVRWSSDGPIVGIVCHGRARAEVANDVVDAVMHVNRGRADADEVRAALMAEADAILDAPGQRAA